MGLDTQGGEDNMAVLVKNAVKSYEKKGPRILDNLNMSVPRGCIYGLLGASGAGKTTLLSAIVGLLKLDSGEVRVLGGTPGEKGSGVPGPRIGYMPQEVALVDEFTIKDAFSYFGLVHGMNRGDIRERFEFLSNVLQLPGGDAFVSNLSGGQKRRLSLAVALVHKPELLILDEPTVGQDPILRYSIWQYLVELSEKENMTVIITTHYIEEAKASHKIGFLRNGTLLAETSPNHLLAQFNCDSLEDVSLLLSQRQTDRNRIATGDHNLFEMQPTSSTSEIPVLHTEDCPDPYEFVAKPHKQTTGRRLKSSALSTVTALLYKNFLRLFRNYPGLLFTFGFPIFLFSCFFLALGGDLKQVPIGIVNEELGDCYQLPGGIENNTEIKLGGELEDECLFTGLSCLFIDKIRDDKVKILQFTTLEEGLKATQQGKTFSTLHIPENFTLAMQTKFPDPFHAENDTLEMTEISIWMDMTDYIIANGLKSHYLERYQKLEEFIAQKCGFSPKSAGSPLKIYDPVFGDQKVDHSTSMAPGFLLVILVFMTTTHSSSIILMEKIEGIWNRNLVAGVTTSQIIVTHLILHLFIIMCQLAEVLLVGFYLFGMHLAGSMWAMIGLGLLQAICGACVGMTISVLSSNLTMAYVAGTGFFWPYTLTCGILWPIEGMSFVIRMVSLSLPGCWATKAFNNILYRGWDITHPEVYPGFLVTLMWIVILMGVTLFFLKRAKV